MDIVRKAEGEMKAHHYIVYGVLVVVGLGVLYYIWHKMHDDSDKKKEAAGLGSPSACDGTTLGDTSCDYIGLTTGYHPLGAPQPLRTLCGAPPPCRQPLMGGAGAIGAAGVSMPIYAMIDPTMQESVYTYGVSGTSKAAAAAAAGITGVSTEVAGSTIPADLASTVALSVADAAQKAAAHGHIKSAVMPAHISPQVVDAVRNVAKKASPHLAPLVDRIEDNPSYAFKQEHDDKEAPKIFKSTFVHRAAGGDDDSDDGDRLLQDKKGKTIVHESVMRHPQDPTRLIACICVEMDA